MANVKVDDLDNTVHTNETPVHTWYFGWGTAPNLTDVYEIDLTASNFDNIESMMGDYVKAARPFSVPNRALLVRAVAKLARDVEATDDDDYEALAGLLRSFVAENKVESDNSTAAAPAAPRKTRAASTATALDTYGYTAKEVRAWAKENGIKNISRTGAETPVGDVGRMTQNVYDAYKAKKDKAA